MRAIVAALLALNLLACDSPSGSSSDPAILRVVSGNRQTATGGSLLPEPIVVQVLDSSERPVGDVVVQWQVISGGGSLAQPTSVTDAAGLASNRWRVGAAGGAGTDDQQRVTASVRSNGAVLSAEFSATAVPGEPAEPV